MTNVLVLNKLWVPINVVSCLRAIHKVMNGRARFLDVDTYNTYDFEGWVENWEDAIKEAKIASDKHILSGARYGFIVPEVIICTEYGGIGYKVSHRKPKFSRTNVYRRDKNTCQLCNKKFKTEDLTIDHVVPKSKGGKLEWTNVALACTSCNNKKGDKTLGEAGMKLIRKPFRPTGDDLKRSPMEALKYKIGRNPPKTWEAFLGKMYWNVELKED
jgi:hypothetical protein